MTNEQKLIHFLKVRKRKQLIFYFTCLTITLFSVILLLILLTHIFHEGWDWVKPEFLTSYPSRFPHKAGIKSSLFGSLWLILMTALFSVPLGIITAFYLEEYAPKNRWFQLLQINISNLAGMPSIVYGLLGLAIFVRFLGFDRSLWSGSFTLSLLVLPVIILASGEAIAAIPDSIRLGAYALGARKWQVIFGQLFPAAIPGIMTGVILALSRAIGESAPLLMVGAVSYAAFVPISPNDPFSALPIQIFNWASRPQTDFHGLAAAAIIVLLIVLFCLNLVAIIIRQRFQRYKK